MTHRGACGIMIARVDRVAHGGMIGDAGGAALDPFGEANRVALLSNGLGLVTDGPLAGALYGGLQKG
ncbi:MAG: hypothetical protein V4459_02775 [Pseudomonadota bacterium]